MKMVTKTLVQVIRIKLTHS